MKKILCLLLISALIPALAGCGDAAGPPSSPESPSAPVPMPTAAVPPNTIVIDELLSVVNSVLESDEENKFNKNDAEILDIGLSDEDDDIFYMFEKSDVEIAVFEDRQTRGFSGAYFRMLYEDEFTEYNMASFAGAFLMALEPNEYVNMLETVVPAEFYADEETEPERKTCSGELWTIVYHGDLVNILPKE